MDSNSLYYFFSTTAQVLAATSALLAIFAQFKITEISSYLIGDGSATLARMENEEEGYRHPNPEEKKKWIDRMRDAIGRKSIAGILEAIVTLANHESQQGKQDRPRGLTFLITRFRKKEKQLKDLKSITLKSIRIAFVSILLSLISLPFVQYIKSYLLLSSFMVAIVLFFGILSMFFTLKGIKSGLENTDEA